MLTVDPAATDRLWQAVAGQCLRLVQGPLGRSLADHAARAAAGEIAHPDAAAALCVFTAVMARGKIDMVAIEAALRG